MPDRLRQIRHPRDIEAALADFPALRDDRVRGALMHELASLGPHEIRVTDDGRGYHRTGR